METRDVKVATPDGEYTNLEVLNARLELITVYDDRFPNQSWAAPTMHKGAPIEDRTPMGIALLGMALLEEALAQAKSLAK